MGAPCLGLDCDSEGLGRSRGRGRNPSPLCSFVKKAAHGHKGVKVGVWSGSLKRLLLGLSLIQRLMKYRKSGLISSYGKLCSRNTLDKCKKAAGETVCLDPCTCSAYMGWKPHLTVGGSAQSLRRPGRESSPKMDRFRPFRKVFSCWSLVNPSHPVYF